MCVVILLLTFLKLSSYYLFFRLVQMSDNFRLRICDKFLHSMEGIQRNLCENAHSARRVEIPSYVSLESGDIHEVKKLGL